MITRERLKSNLGTPGRRNWFQILRLWKARSQFKISELLLWWQKAEIQIWEKENEKTKIPELDLRGRNQKSEIEIIELTFGHKSPVMIYLPSNLKVSLPIVTILYRVESCPKYLKIWFNKIWLKLKQRHFQPICPRCFRRLRPRAFKRYQNGSPNDIFWATTAIWSLNFSKKIAKKFNL